MLKRWLCWLTVLALALAPCALAEGGNIFNILSGVAYGQSSSPQQDDPAAVLQPEDPAQLPSGKGSPDADLTLMVYLCGSNLESRGGSATLDLIEMSTSGYDDEAVNIVVMAGGATTWKNGVMPRRSTGIYAMQDGYLVPMRVDEEPQNMGDPETLLSFLNYAYENYPAQRHALILWDHGGGSLLGICNDELFDGDSLNMVELVSALDASPVSDEKLEWIGFDACLMASAEVARLMAPYASYMIASEDSEPSSGWNYSFLDGIEDDASGGETGKRVVDAYFEVPPRANVALTMSCIDLSRMDEITESASALFATLESGLNQDNFAEASRARRKARAFGRDEETADNDFDLVDMGDLAQMYERGDDVMPALNNGVVYTRANVDGCTGLSLYHPFYNRKLFIACKDYYSVMGFSSEYDAYVNKFYSFMQNDQPSGWNNLSAFIGAPVRDVRTILSLQLTDEQYAQLGTLELVALERGPEEDSYHLVATQEVEVSDDGMISGEYVHTNLFVTDAAGEPVWDLPLLYTVRDDGSYHVQVTLSRGGEDPVDARLICSRDEETNQVSVDMVWLYDEVTGVYSPRASDPLESYDTITFTQINRTVTQDESGAMLPFAEWEQSSVEEYSFAVDSDWHLAFVRDHLDVAGLSVGFEITDIYNVPHLSNLIPVEAAPVDNEGMVVTYDDLDLLYIDADSVSLTSDASGGLLLSAQLMNISGAEATVEAANVRVNGTALSSAATVYGTGESDGLLPLETQMLMLPLNLDELGDASAIETIEFDLRLVGADGQELGVVPVSIQANLPL